MLADEKARSDENQVHTSERVQLVLLRLLNLWSGLVYNVVENSVSVGRCDLHMQYWLTSAKIVHHPVD